MSKSLDSRQTSPWQRCQLCWKIRRACERSTTTSTDRRRLFVFLILSAGLSACVTTTTTTYWDNPDQSRSFNADHGHCQYKALRAPIPAALTNSSYPSVNHIQVTSYQKRLKTACLNSLGWYISGYQ